MQKTLLNGRIPAGLVWVVVWLFFLGLGTTSQSRAADPAPTENLPPRVELPAEWVAFIGKDVVLGSSVWGTPPLSYQWYFNDQLLTNATLQNLTFTNLDVINRGLYFLTVSNQFGVATSSTGLLRVLLRPLPTLNFGTYQTPASQTDVSIPVFYSSEGIETNLTFSFGYDPAVLTNASFQPYILQNICNCATQNNTTASDLIFIPIPPVGTNTDATGGRLGQVSKASLSENSQVILDTTQSATGRLGVSIVLPAGQRFEPGFSNLIGNLVFNLVPGVTNPYSGRVVFASQPLPLKYAPAGDAGELPATAPLLPLWTTNAPALNRQSGLIEQALQLTNPGDMLSNVRLYVQGLDVDSRSNRIQMFNAIGSTVVGTNVIALLDLGGMGPGEARSYTLEYYVSDRNPAIVNPTLDFRSVPAAVVIPSGTELAIHNYRFTNGVFLVEFPTRAGYRYYVQYAPAVAETNAPSFKTSLPAVFGTGSYVQWLDNGPPKSDPLPINGMRLYRLIETR
jgi:hypothetical protein